MQTIIPNAFRERLNRLADDPKAFFQSLETRPPKSFRVNPLKAQREDVSERMERAGIALHRVPWYDDAFISEDPNLGSTLDHFAGKIYIQELASMLPPLAVREEIAAARSVLDLCAAPGSKTTQCAALQGNRGAIVANDSDFMRSKALRFNLEKQGVLNTLLTNFDGRFVKYPAKFPVVLVDAPCSSEGTIRRSWNVLSRWSVPRIHALAGLQTQLILTGFDHLQPGGVLVYSTCTFAPEENEAVVNYLLQKRPEASIEPAAFRGLKTKQGIPEWDRNQFDPLIRHAVRVWPHHNDTEGFFLAKVRRAA